MRELVFKKQNRAIFGCGVEANALYYRMQQAGVSIDYFIDNYRTESFWGHDVYRLETLVEENKLKSTFIYIPSSKYFDVLKKQLKAYGLTEFVDYVKGGVFQKRVVFINANCYGPKIADCLMSNEEFRDRYFIYLAKPIYEEKKDFKIDEYLPHCDVFLHQDIRQENPYGREYSDDYTISRLKEECVQITIPNLVGMGKMLFPQAYMIEDDRNNEAGAMFGFFPQGDLILDRLVKEYGVNIDRILNEYEGQDVFSEEEIWENLEKTVNKYRQRENNWDIKIVGFIESHYKLERMFYDLYHPTNIVYQKMVEQILIKLGVENTSVEQKYCQNEYEIPLYPRVAQVLGLQYFDKERNLRKESMFKFQEKMDHKEWAREYITWCYDRKR